MPVIGDAASLPRSGASSSVESHRAEVGPRKCGSLKQSVRNLSGKLEDVPLWKEHFEVFRSMVGCMSSFLAVHDMMMGDVPKGTQHLISQVFSDDS